MRKSYDGVEDMTVAVMGCVVNGPGESKHANIGISLPGTGERPVAPVYIDGEKGPTLKGEKIAEEFQELVEQYVARRFARKDDRRSNRGERMSSSTTTRWSTEVRALPRRGDRADAGRSTEEVGPARRRLEPGRRTGRRSSANSSSRISTAR
jgi:hypothetical protein